MLGGLETIRSTTYPLDGDGDERLQEVAMKLEEPMGGFGAPDHDGPAGSTPAVDGARTRRGLA